MNERLSILVSGRIASAAGQGGAAWAVLQYILGLRRLGHRVLFAEPVHEWSPAGALQDSANTAFMAGISEAFELDDCWSVFEPGGGQCAGLSQSRMRQEAGSCDLLLNISGLLAEDELMHAIPVRAYLDLDPAFTQLWQDVQGVDMSFSRHNRFATIGMRIGQPDCPIPLCGLDWKRTLQPVVLEHWPFVPPPAEVGGQLTAIANWRSYGSIEADGVFYGQKAHSWRPLMKLPRLLKRPVAAALAIHPDERGDLVELRAGGWNLIDPESATATTEAYQRFVRDCWAELGIAKSGYVHSRCGWFSDRSVCFLASGRPVVAQETGFSEFLPCGEGLLPFEDSESAAEAVQRLEKDYSGHVRSARRIAEGHFDSDRVLKGLLREIVC